MKSTDLVAVRLLVAVAVLTASVGQSLAQGNLAACSEVAFSTEEDFVTQGPEPPDGNPIISDGDLLGFVEDPAGNSCVVCLRNSELMSPFGVSVDVGLDAVDVIAVSSTLVAFSTELDSPIEGQFFSGDLLATNGTIIPNVVLTNGFSVGHDLGLDAVHFVGTPANIISFLTHASQFSRDDWLQNPGNLAGDLDERSVDIWFSTEKPFRPTMGPSFSAGDLLSAQGAVIVVSNDQLLPSTVPAGIPMRGVDFGVDAAACMRTGVTTELRFSTEVVNRGVVSFTDGDVLWFGAGPETEHAELIACFQPKSDFLGLDALYLLLDQVQ
jgi:hypothetical protein